MASATPVVSVDLETPAASGFTLVTLDNGSANGFVANFDSGKGSLLPQAPVPPLLELTHRTLSSGIADINNSISATNIFSVFDSVQVIVQASVPEWSVY